MGNSRLTVAKLIEIERGVPGFGVIERFFVIWTLLRRSVCYFTDLRRLLLDLEAFGVSVFFFAAFLGVLERDLGFASAASAGAGAGAGAGAAGGAGGGGGAAVGAAALLLVDGDPAVLFLLGDSEDLKFVSLRLINWLSS